MSEEIKEMNPDDKNHKKDSDGYEKICYLCHRPESKVDKMITIPNQITICSDCMQTVSYTHLTLPTNSRV